MATANRDCQQSFTSDAECTATNEPLLAQFDRERFTIHQLNSSVRHIDRIVRYLRLSSLLLSQSQEC